MFTMPAIHHASIKDDGGTMGTMPLNALNGSSSFLGCVQPSPRVSQTGAFGGLVGSSLSENHPYRPQDSGMTFQKMLDARHKDSMAHLRGSESASPVAPRRHSLDLHVMSSRPANTHPRYRDRSLSLDEQLIGPFSRLGGFLDDTIDEQEQTSEQEDIPGQGVPSSDLAFGHTGHRSVKDHTDQTKVKKRKSHNVEAFMSQKALRLLDKIKDSRKDHDSNCRHHGHKETSDKHRKSDMVQNLDQDNVHNSLETSRRPEASHRSHRPHGSGHSKKGRKLISQTSVD